MDRVRFLRPEYRPDAAEGSPEEKNLVDVHDAPDDFLRDVFSFAFVIIGEKSNSAQDKSPKDDHCHNEAIVRRLRFRLLRSDIPNNFGPIAQVHMQ